MPSITGTNEGLYDYLNIDNSNPSWNGSPLDVLSNGVGKGKLGGFLLENNDQSHDVYLQIFDKAAAGVSLGTDVPVMSFHAPAGSTIGFSPEEIGLKHFEVSCSIAVTTTRKGSTLASVIPSVQIWSKAQ